MRPHLSCLHLETAPGGGLLPNAGDPWARGRAWGAGSWWRALGKRIEVTDSRRPPEPSRGPPGPKAAPAPPRVTPASGQRTFCVAALSPFPVITGLSPEAQILSRPETYPDFEVDFSYSWMSTQNLVSRTDFIPLRVVACTKSTNSSRDLNFACAAFLNLAFLNSISRLISPN